MSQGFISESNGTTGALLIANNLSDVANSQTSLANLQKGGYNQIAITTTTTLTGTALGSQVLCTGSSAYAVTLPTMAANTFIDFNILTTSNPLVTLTPPSGTIQLQSTFILGAGESCRVYSDGTNYWIENLNLMPVGCSVYQASGQNGITTATKIALNTVSFDIGTFFDYTTNYRYTPLYPGLYQFNLAGSWNGDGSHDAVCVYYIYKNGSVVYGLAQTLVNASAQLSIGLPITLEMNGTSDYIEMFGGTNMVIALIVTFQH